ncbi:MAG TPA: hydrogenase maturation nickel metallochaperone HypA [Acidimicrobiia bacterium]|nr:hydrogenase maturation nickel metallochaperone HypA [Acidimicrobiia bacterium]
MHELSVAEAIAGAVNRHADGRTVTKVLVRIGHLRQVVPDALSFAWEMLTTGSDLEGSVLEIESVPATVACRACGAETTLDMPITACGQCYSRDVELLTGEEFAVVSLELADV